MEQVSDIYIYDLDQNLFNKFKEFIQFNTGIFLSNEKMQLLKGRINKRIRLLKLRGFEDYYNYLTKNVDELPNFLNEITTNVTHFYREKSHLDLLTEKILPELSKIKNEIHIWSAGCSNGSEPYSINMAIKEYQALYPSKITAEIYIQATDISNKMLKEAINGIYGQEYVRDLPQDVLLRHFKRGIKTQKGNFKVDDKLKKNIQFSYFNLLDYFSFDMKFDVIFCKNVMIYFDAETKRNIVNKFLYKLNPGGYFFVGLSENCNSIKELNVGSSVYRKL